MNNLGTLLLGIAYILGGILGLAFFKNPIDGKKRFILDYKLHFINWALIVMGSISILRFIIGLF